MTPGDAAARSGVSSASPTPDRDTLVRLEDVNLTYGSGPGAVVAVRGVTCEVLAGARLAVTGPSGSGKSSLLHLMAGLERPTAGRVTWPVLGDDPLGQPGVVGVVFQGPSLIPALDVVENVALPLVLAGSTDPDAHARAMDALRTLGVDELANKLPDELSGGQAQRVAIARVMAAGPRLILADEPTGQLDRATGGHVIEVLLAAAEHLGAAVVVSTHDPSVADRLATRWRIRAGSLTPTDGPAQRREVVSR